MAEFCVALRMSPAEFKQLTLLEYAELARAYSRNQGSNESLF
jgi:hypothetical protein